MLMVFLLVVLLLLRFLLVFQIEMYDFNNNNACADNLNPLFSFQNRSFFTALTTTTKKHNYNTSAASSWTRKKCNFLNLIFLDSFHMHLLKPTISQNRHSFVFLLVDLCTAQVKLLKAHTRALLKFLQPSSPAVYARQHFRFRKITL